MSSSQNDGIVTAPPTLQRSVPLVLSIPSLGIRAPLQTLGLNADGTAQVPTNSRTPGWYRLGPSPGEFGAAVILGHVDSRDGPGVFFKLGELRPGQYLYVTLADGKVARFVVNAVDIYAKADFPGRAVYRRTGLSTLQLVTCTGTFDYDTHHYLSNLVVYTSFVSTSRRA